MYTDHKPLQGFLNKDKPIPVMALQEYNDGHLHWLLTSIPSSTRADQLMVMQIP